MLLGQGHTLRPARAGGADRNTSTLHIVRRVIGSMRARQCQTFFRNSDPQPHMARPTVGAKAASAEAFFRAEVSDESFLELAGEQTALQGVSARRGVAKQYLPIKRWWIRRPKTKTASTQ